MKSFLAALVVVTFGATAAMAAEFAEVDADASGTVSMEEFSAAMPDATEDEFKAADADADGQLNEEEFATISQ